MIEMAGLNQRLGMVHDRRHRTSAQRQVEAQHGDDDQHRAGDLDLDDAGNRGSGLRSAALGPGVESVQHDSTKTGWASVVTGRS
jgi:hypothetical protein